MTGFWSISVVDGPLLWIVYALAIAILVCLIVRRWSLRTALVAAIGAVGGALIAIAAFLVSNLVNAFGDPLPHPVAWWSMATLAAMGLAIASLWAKAVWRRIVAGVGIVVFAIAGVLGVNAYYGLNTTLGSLLGISTSAPIVVPTPGPTRTANAGPLYETFTPPADMPAKGQQGTQVIPATKSGFEARPAGIYLPPAALVEDAPPLPLVILMMGFPGEPDVSFAAGVLDSYAAENKGLAPIVIVADQIGPSGNDPACADSKAYGNAETYITEDVVDWARANLNISREPRSWVVGGYSNGGGCAFKYVAQHPDIWKNLLDISGEEFPGSEDVDGVTKTVYGGETAAFEASKPISILQAHAGAYSGVTAIFTVGGNDPGFIPAAKTASEAAQTAGMQVTYDEIPGAGHVVDALNGGLEEGFKVLYPVLGLSAK